MCTLCNLTQTYDPTRHEAGDAAAPGSPVYANVSEGADAAAGIGTAYAIQGGGTFTGSLGTSGDRDWVAVTLQEGETYQINLTGDSLSDPYLRLFNSNGALVAENDDFGGTYDSQMTFTASATGTYYISAAAWNDQGSGSYTMSVAPTAPPAEASLDELADFLIDGYWSRRSFDTSQDNQITVNLTALTAEGQQLARWALEAWEMVADLDFVEVTGGADITFDDNQPGAFAASTYSGSTITSSTVNVSTQWIDTYGAAIDSYTFSTYLHEIGHALGLGHQGNYNGNASYGTHETFANDSWQVSVMSYFSQSSNTAINASYAETVSPMMVDIIAIQSLYGAPGGSSATAGNTTWGAGSALGTYLDQVFDYLDDGSNPDVSGGPMAMTIYDRSGIDTLDLSFSGGGDRIDLRAEQFSDIGGLLGNVGIARGTVIENLIAGTGNDTITGNDAANTIDGGGGNDSVDGGAGFDTIDGGAGNDTLEGGTHADLITGGAGDDLINGGEGFDVLHGDGGHDTINGGNAQDRLFGGDGDDLLVGGINVGISIEGLWGGTGNDTLLGGAGYDLLDGGAGHDYLDGGHQADNLYGGGGQDTLRGDQGLDRLFGGDGNDWLYGGDGPDGHFGEAGDDTLLGGTGNDRFFGGIGNDTLNGGSGQDTIYGGAGFDTLEGGSGNDLLYGNFNADVFVFADGHGNDTVTDFDATNDFEQIDLSGVSAIGNMTQLAGAASQAGSDVLIDTGAGSSIRLSGVSLSDLDSGDFIF